MLSVEFEGTSFTKIKLFADVKIPPLFKLVVFSFVALGYQLGPWSKEKKTLFIIISIFQ
jgi:hypothetical protein